MMKDPRNLLILLGFICQGFVWDNYWMPALYAVVWLVCLKMAREKQFIPDSMEFMIFGLGFILAVFFGRGENLFMRSIFIGNCLVVLQGMRLMWPINHRKKLLSIEVAIVQLAIGSLIVVDYTFIIILAAAIYLLPRSFYDLARERYEKHSAMPLAPFGKKEVFVIAVVMIIFFLIFPRWELSPDVTSGLMMFQGRVMRPQMQATAGSGDTDDRIIFQINGAKVDYLKSYALDTYNGTTWQASPPSFALKRKFRNLGYDKCMYRKVVVRDLKSLGRALPTDGHVVNLEGNFFHDAYISRQDNVIVPLVWPATNNNYEYWTSSEFTHKLNPRASKRYLAFPQSAKILDFVNKIIGDEKDPFEQAKKLERHLLDNFKYKEGAPDLDRMNPVEDFLFSQKEGHCEWFASAMALMLRMKGIPSRVVIGFFANEKNQIGDFFNVRAKHAHAWTEAFFKGKGWQIIDATPYVAQVGTASSSLALSIYDWIEFFWYSKVVNFSHNDQKNIFSLGPTKMKVLWLLARGSVYLVIALIIIIIAVKVYKNGFKWLFKFMPEKKLSREQQIEEARHFYGQMMRVLAKKKFLRLPTQTPFEFLSEIRRLNYLYCGEVEFITVVFCKVKYGGADLNIETKHKISQMIEGLKKS